MAETPKWTSSRVATSRAAQQSSQGSSGSSQSRWAPSSTSASSGGGSPSSSSSWRSRAADAAASTSGSSASRWGQGSSSNTAKPNAGSGASRWATSAHTTTNPIPARSTAVPDDPSISALTNTLQRTSIRFTSQAPSIHLQTPQSQQQQQPSPRTTPRNDGLTVRNEHRPLGGKSLDRLALLASPSRGLDSTSSLSSELSSQGSMDLTSPSVQHEFRAYISERIGSKAVPLLSSTGVGMVLGVLESSKYLPVAGNERTGTGLDKVGEGEEELQQILLLVRKLREALVASKRIDEFAVEVYELSVYLSLLCCDVPQLAATLPRLVLELYPSLPSSTLASDQDSEPGDIEVLAKQLQVTLMGKREEGRMRMISLYMLQTLCLSGRATRLGQYTKSDSVGVLEPLHRGFREYRSQRQTLASLYGQALHPQIKFCDSVHSALRDVDPFKYAQLLKGEGEGGGGGYDVDGWQKLVLLQALPLLRNASWAVARKAYMYLPLPKGVVRLIKSAADVEGGTTREDRFLVELLLLGTDLLPASSIADGNVQKAEVKVQVETPDEWDTEEEEQLDLEASNDVENERLYYCLTGQFGTSLPDRLMVIKEGFAVKLK